MKKGPSNFSLHIKNKNYIYMVTLMSSLVIWGIVIFLLTISYKLAKYSIKELNIKSVKDLMRYLLNKS